MRNFGSGFIAWWHGALNNIPVGWALCNGKNGTPDLRDQFILGAGTTPAGATGGSATHTHPFTGSDHYHRMGAPGSDIEYGPNFTPETSFDPITGITDPSSSLSPYYALAYIMEL